jgi:hypothetical protein
MLEVSKCLRSSDDRQTGVIMENEFWQIQR